MPPAPESAELFTKKAENVPVCHSDSVQRSGGIYPSCGNNLRKVKLAAWEDPSTRFAPSG